MNTVRLVLSTPKARVYRDLRLVGVVFRWNGSGTINVCGQDSKEFDCITFGFDKFRQLKAPDARKLIAQRATYYLHSRK